MGTAERREALEKGAAAGGTALRDPEASGGGNPANEHMTAERRDSSTDGRGATDRGSMAALGAVNPARAGVRRTGAAGGGDVTATGQERAAYRPLWVEEPARRRRMPDPVRTAAVRAVLLIAVTLIQAMVAFLCTLAGSWLAFPMVISGVVSTVLATWGALDVWVTRQVWNQRNGVVSTPSSTARSLRRERRRARRQTRVAERAQERIRRQSGTGQLSHP
ncbi:hypothetical protein SAMN04487983_1012140 [Streptomyces sp. yr375]|uniref:hypothetical protein n=1 Tax=Streptomyces sp. yr375 TaxID=1761906 RepID=UPI0008BC4794|nr:hypothetical protein [Streptomyces sp. yr375]SER20189.1 hypothetical protein SAMN04487983_1012140 [Streptomyces sp. yr375]